MKFNYYNEYISEDGNNNNHAQNMPSLSLS